MTFNGRVLDRCLLHKLKELDMAKFSIPKLEQISLISASSALLFSTPVTESRLSDGLFVKL